MNLRIRQAGVVEMSDVIVEYLASLTITDSFCDSADGFRRLLCVDSKVKLHGDLLSYEDQRVCTLTLAHGNVPTGDWRFFRVRFSAERHHLADADWMQRLRAVRKTVRKIVKQSSGWVETLRDDVSAHFSQQAYPHIHQIESLMRQLIATFMLTNLGVGWTKGTLPDEVQRAVKTSKRPPNDNSDILYSLDFKHLGDFLFEPYSKISTDALHNRIRNCKTTADVDALKSDLPASNWNRYFKALVDCQDSQLKAKWEKLYELRCKVAHNALMTAGDLENIVDLVSDVRPLLESALDKLSLVQVPPQEVEQLAEQAVSGRSAAIGEFITAWRQLESRLLHLQGAEHGTPEPLKPSPWVFGPGEMKAFAKLRSVRNAVVHQHGSANEAELAKHTALVEALLEVANEVDYIAYLRNLSEQRRDEVIQDLMANTDGQLLEADSFCDNMAMTNASDFSVDEVNVEDVRFENDECVVNVSFVASGHSEPDKMFYGDKIRGTAEAVIDGEGDVEFRVVRAEIDHGDDDDAGLVETEDVDEDESDE